MIRALIFFILMSSSCIYAQTPSPILAPGDVVVTGFSKILNSVDHKNEQFIDLNGPSVKIISLPTSANLGLLNTTKQITIKAHDVGQVFGVALDNETPPSIFVAATSAYGLAIYKAGKGRVQYGTPGAQFVPGLFGPLEQGGGSTSIWRIDGKTGKVSLFANVIYNGIENSPGSLGGLAFDAASQQLFVANRTTGTIHRFTLDGVDHGVYDHGIEGLPAIGKQSIPFDPATLSNIKSSRFDTKNPLTWGLAPLERRVFALAVHQHRLYYSVSGSQIWSVGIDSEGSFAKNARFEIDSSARANNEISSIAFDINGWMYIAERGFPTGEENFIHLTESGEIAFCVFLPKRRMILLPKGGFRQVKNIRSVCYLIIKMQMAVLI